MSTSELILAVADLKVADRISNATQGNGPIYAALVTAPLSFLGALLVSWFSSRQLARSEKIKADLELAKLDRAREDTLAKELREAYQCCIATMASLSHNLCWLSWFGLDANKQLTQERIKTYDDEMHQLWPKVMGQQALLSSYDVKAGGSLAELMGEIEGIDSDIAEAAWAFVGGSTDAARAFATLHSKACATHDRLMALCAGKSLKA